MRAPCERSVAHRVWDAGGAAAEATRRDDARDDDEAVVS